jgi:hypothetical protein
MEVIGIFYGDLFHFTVFCYNLWTFGIVHGNLVYFSRFGILYQEKSGNPATHPDKRTLRNKHPFFLSRFFQFRNCFSKN